MCEFFAGPRQQANTITHFFDASSVYGSSKDQADALRSFRDGKMKVQTVNGHTLPPPNTKNCPASTSGRCPFLAGDNRVNTTRKCVPTTYILEWCKLDQMFYRVPDCYKRISAQMSLFTNLTPWSVIHLNQRIRHKLQKLTFNVRIKFFYWN